jgi:hypothetical protein
MGAWILMHVTTIQMQIVMMEVAHMLKRILIVMEIAC